MVINPSDTIHKVKSTVQQVQNNMLSKEFLMGNTIKFFFEFFQKIASDRGLEPLIKIPSDLFQVEMSYLYRPAKNMLNIFIHIPFVHPENTLQMFN